MTTDPLERLTVAELDAGSRLLKTDLVTAIAEDRAEKWAGLAITAWLLARRDDPSALLSPYRAMGANELYTALGVAAEPDPDPAADVADDGQADASDDAEATGPAEAVEDTPDASVGLADDLDLDDGQAEAVAQDATGATPSPLPAVAAAEAVERAALRARIAADPMGRRRG